MHTGAPDDQQSAAAMIPAVGKMASAVPVSANGVETILAEDVGNGLAPAEGEPIRSPDKVIPLPQPIPTGVDRRPTSDGDSRDAGDIAAIESRGVSTPPPGDAEPGFRRRIRACVLDGRQVLRQHNPASPIQTSAGPGCRINQSHRRFARNGSSLLSPPVVPAQTSAMPSWPAPPEKKRRRIRVPRERRAPSRLVAMVASIAPDRKPARQIRFQTDAPPFSVKRAYRPSCVRNIIGPRPVCARNARHRFPLASGWSYAPRAGSSPPSSYRRCHTENGVEWPAVLISRAAK